MKSPRGIKKTKSAPTSANKVKLYATRLYTLYWKGRARARRPGALKPSKPRPKRWANIVVFLHDTTKRKRSFHIAWNGTRYNDAPEVHELALREPEVYADVREVLGDFNDKLVKGWRKDGW